MSLVKSKELFSQTAFPISVDRVQERALVQKELHRHDYFEMLYVESGSLINRFVGQDILMQAGDVLILKPYVRHVLAYAAPEETLQAYCCSFLPQMVDCTIGSMEEVKVAGSPNRYFFKPFLALADDSLEAVRFRLADETRVEISRLLRRLNETTHACTEQDDAWSRCYFLNLLAVLSDAYALERGSRCAADGEEVLQQASRYHAGLRKVLCHIHDHFKEPITLGQMVAMSGVSETYFCRLFKHETGMTFLNYLNSLRIEEACIRLRNTSETMQETCYNVGFNDYSHFSRQFKKTMGVPPSAIRKKCR